MEGRKGGAESERRILVATFLKTLIAVIPLVVILPVFSAATTPFLLYLVVDVISKWLNCRTIPPEPEDSDTIIHHHEIASFFTSLIHPVLFLYISPLAALAPLTDGAGIAFMSTLFFGFFLFFFFDINWNRFNVTITDQSIRIGTNKNPLKSVSFISLGGPLGDRLTVIPKTSLEGLQKPIEQDSGARIRRQLIQMLFPSGSQPFSNPQRIQDVLVSQHNFSILQNKGMLSLMPPSIKMICFFAFNTVAIVSPFLMPVVINKWTSTTLVITTMVFLFGSLIGNFTLWALFLDEVILFRPREVSTSEEETEKPNLFQDLEDDD